MAEISLKTVVIQVTWTVTVTETVRSNQLLNIKSMITSTSKPVDS